MKTFKRILALVLAATMLFSLAACGNKKEAGKNAIKDLVTYETQAREIEDWNILHSQNATDFYVTANLVSGLGASDKNGQLIPAIAESWSTNEDATVWTFKLRKDYTWVDKDGNEKAKITSADFVCGLEWVLNAKKNENANTSMATEMIKGAAEYNELTNNMSDEEALALSWNNETFLKTVGISTPDDYTVVYTMVSAKPYFYTVATYSCLYPASPAQVTSMTAEQFRAITWETMWYCGPYLIKSFVDRNEKVFVPNPKWADASNHKRFDSITVKMVDSTDTAFTLYQSGDIDNVELTESQMKTIQGTENEKYLSEKRPTKYSYQIHFSYNKNKTDGTADTNWNTAVANEAFRLAWYYGLDLTSYYKRTNAVNPLKCENNFYTMKGLVFTSDGTEYTDLVKKELGLGDYNGKTMVRYNKEKFDQYKAQAKQELAALGVTFPIVADYYIAASSQTALDTANVLKDAFSEFLGDDFVTLNICTYTSSLAKEVRNPQLASFYINGWGADYGDPQNYLGQETFGDKNAYYSGVYSRINDYYENEDAAYSKELIAAYKEYTELVKAADKIVNNLDERYKAYAKAEACLIKHAFVIPCSYSITWQLTKINDYSKPNPMYGIVSDHYYVDWETNAEGYTTADYEELAKQK